MYAHLNAEHPAAFICPYCNQTISLSERTISEHLSGAHAGFEEYQCLICWAGFNTIHEIRKHHSLLHSSNYLFVGARRTTKPMTDRIQLVYVGALQNDFPYTLAKCSTPDALNVMDPTKLLRMDQLETLKKLEIVCQDRKIVFSEPAPRIPSVKSFDIMDYEAYEKLVPLIVEPGRMPDESINHAPQPQVLHHRICIFC